MESPPPAERLQTDVRLLVLEAEDHRLSEQIGNALPHESLQVDAVRSFSDALTRVRQRTSTGLGYASIVARSECIEEDVAAFERLIASNADDGLVLVVGALPEQLDDDRPDVFAVDGATGPDGDSLRLELLLRVIQNHGETAQLQSQLEQLESENEQLRNRLGLAEKRVQHLNRVFHHARDPVTGVADREFLVESLEIELEHQERVVKYEFAFCILEIDEFDEHLGELGRETLDKALVQMTSRVLDTLRTTDRIGRLNQQQFGLILGHSPTKTDVRMATTRLLDALSAPIQVKGMQLDLSYSVGVTVSGPQHDTPEHVVQDANLAVAESRTERGTEFTVYDHDYSGDGVEDTALARQMARELHAKEESGFYLKYQPIYRLPDGEIAGFEALCRWNHPDRGEIGPNKFIAIAEYTHLIQDLGLWTIEEAGRKLETWKHYDDIHELPFLTVNLSKEQLQSEEFASRVIEILKPFDIELEHLIVELRETATIEQHDAAVTNLGQLKSFGIGIAVDDFGVAHSSFASLYRLPVDILKIDRSLISRLSDSGDPGHKIVQHLLNLCHEMGLTAIAEGVEATEEHEAIIALGCDYAQGYEYTGALPPEVADRRLLATPDEVDTDSMYVDDEQES